MKGADTVGFRCNICGTVHEAVPRVLFGREDPSCSVCGSSVRMRGVVHHLSFGLFGVSIALPEFPRRPDLVGIGLSDWEGYAVALANRLGYVNTFYHQEPRLDITAPPAQRFGTCDFLISTDVFEHVPPPVELAYRGAFALLKPGGLLVLTVPFTDVPQTVEHFPDLHVYKLVELGGEWVLVNRDASGQLSVRRNLVFHGGPGTTLEMRTPARSDTIRLLEESGFSDIVVHGDAAPQWGVLPPHHHGLPITARRPAAARRRKRSG
jgi:hypothetical protein